MTLLITAQAVSEVLLSDGWHAVDDQSFDIDEYEFIKQVESGNGEIIHGAGQYGICAAGFTFMSNGKRISGPLTAIHAVKEL